MKKAFLFLPVILILCFSCNSQKGQYFSLQGEISGQDSGIIVLTYYSNSMLIRDTAEIKNGKFNFTGKISEPTRTTLRDRNRSELAVVYFEPGKMKISITKERTTKFKMTGSKTQKESDLLKGMINPLYNKISSIRVQTKRINDSIKKINDTSVKKILEKEIEAFDIARSKVLKSIDSTEINFVIKNPNAFISVVYLSMLNANEVISLDSAKSIFNKLDNSLKNTSYGKSIKDDIRKKDNILIGAQAPNFTATDLNKQTVTLSQFKSNSVILLDFWASWCVPCRESIPHLKTLYEKYHTKGFEIVAVTLDENRKAWIDAVNSDSTGMWFHVPIAEQYAKGPDYITNDDIYKNYFVQAIPVTIVIDKNGKILSRLVGQSKENEESLEKLLSQVFN
jgi:thiol-disulfide isomerase/thioredoxin